MVAPQILGQKTSIVEFKKTILDRLSTSDREARDARSWSVRAMRAEAFIELGDFGGACHEVDAALFIKPNELALYRMRILLNWQLSNWAQIETDATHAYQVTGDVEWLKYRSGAKQNHGDYRGSLEDLDEAIRRGDRDYDTFMRRSLDLIILGRIDEAIESYERAIAALKSESGNEQWSLDLQREFKNRIATLRHKR